MYMKKYFPVVLLVLGFLIVGYSPAQATGQAAWNIKWNSNGSLDETVTIRNHNIIIQDNEWQTSRSDQGLILTRHINNWQEYSKLGDGLPLELSQKDFWLIKSSTLTMKEQARPGSLYEQLTDFGGARLSIEVPGIIRESTAQEKIDSTAVWTLGTADAVTLNAVVFDGIVLGIAFFALCAIIILIIFLSRIRRVNRLIAQEYSLERAAEEFARGDMEEQENQ